MLILKSPFQKMKPLFNRIHLKWKGLVLQQYLRPTLPQAAAVRERMQCWVYSASAKLLFKSLLLILLQTGYLKQLELQFYFWSSLTSNPCCFCELLYNATPQKVVLAFSGHAATLVRDGNVGAEMAEQSQTQLQFFLCHLLVLVAIAMLCGNLGAALSSLLLQVDISGS